MQTKRIDTKTPRHKSINQQSQHVYLQTYCTEEVVVQLFEHKSVDFVRPFERIEGHHV